LTDLDRSPDARFYGFDSFGGLPEDWGGTAAERLGVGDALPIIDDDRAKLLKGWFRASLPPIMGELNY
jgi:hypothetical protein